jgi:hypothetical protein
VIDLAQTTHGLNHRHTAMVSGRAEHIIYHPDGIESDTYYNVPFRNRTFL